MNLFQIIWPEHTFHEGENSVSCLFHDDDKASAHVNYDKGVFHCKVCDIGLSSVGLVEKYMKVDKANAAKVANAINNAQDLFDWNPFVLDLKQTPEAKKFLTQFGIKESVLDEVHAGFVGQGISLPVTLGGFIVDVRTYNPTKDPKVMSKTGAISGFVFPEKAFDSKSIFLVEGEKDALSLRSLGLNAATVTGGAMAKPDKTPYLFDKKNIVIVYDNDDAGMKGARKVATYLLEHKGIDVKVKIADIGPLVDGKNKGDVTDAIHEYSKTMDDFVKLAKDAPMFKLEDVKTEPVRVSEYKEVKLEEADKYIGTLLKSKVQVSAAYDSSYSVPKSADFTDKDMAASWLLEPKKNMKDVLYQLENNGDRSINPTGISKSEFDKESLRIDISPERRRVFKALLSSTTEDLADSDKMATEHTALIMDNPVDSGKEYMIYYRVTPHPKTNRSILLVHAVEDLSKLHSKFIINDEIKTSLDKFQTKSFPELIEQAKGIINANFNTKLVTVLDLTFHSVLSYNFGRYKLIKGTIDSIVITDTGFGKSVSTQALLKWYGQGGRASLTGSAATATGLIGGSKPVANGAYQTTAGLIPRMHKKIVILEELAKAKADFMKELTDIRTSGKAEITRVSGKISLPANTRLAFLSNPKAGVGGGNKTVDAYPNGIEIVQDLVGAREDVGRFGLIAVLGQRESIEDDPSWEPATPFDQQDYRNRLNWIWTRAPEQISFSKEVTKYIAQDKTKELNDLFESDTQIFGRKTWMKLSQVSVAIAGYMGSHSDDYESIIVTKEHVDLAVKLFKELYDNPTFKLAQHVLEERSYTKMDEASTGIMKRIYNNQNQIITQLGLVSEIQTNELQTVSALDRQEFIETISDLTKFKLIRNVKGKILPTEKFRKTLDVVAKEPPGLLPETLEEGGTHE